MRFIDEADHKEIPVVIPSAFEDYFTGNADIFLSTNYSNRELGEEMFTSKQEYDKYKTSCLKGFEKKPLKPGTSYFTVFVNEPVVFVKTSTGSYTSRFTINVPRVNMKIKYAGSLEYVENSKQNFMYSDNREFKTSVSLIHQLTQSSTTERLVEYTYRLTYCLDVIYSLYLSKVDFNAIMALASPNRPDNYEQLVKEIGPDTPNLVLTCLLTILGISSESIWDGNPASLVEDEMIYPWDHEAFRSHAFCDVYKLTNDNIDFKNGARLQRVITRRGQVRKGFKEDTLKEIAKHLEQKVDSPMTFAAGLSANEELSSKRFLSMKFTYTAEKDKSYHKTYVVKKVNSRLTQSQIKDLKEFLTVYGSPVKTFKSVECNLMLKMEVRHKKTVGVIIVYHVAMFNPLRCCSGPDILDVSSMAAYIGEYESGEEKENIVTPKEEDILIEAFEEDFN